MCNKNMVSKGKHLKSDFGLSVHITVGCMAVAFLCLRHNL